MSLRSPIFRRYADLTRDLRIYLQLALYVCFGGLLTDVQEHRADTSLKSVSGDRINIKRT